MPPLETIINEIEKVIGYASHSSLNICGEENIK